MSRGVALGVDRVRAGYRDREVIREVSLDVDAGAFAGLIGPNACGKSTLLRVASRTLRPTGGKVILGRRDLWREWKPREAARTVAVVRQDFPSDFPFTVEETVMMGRTPYVERLRGERPLDLACVHGAMRDTGILHLAGRPVSALAGGERQKVVLAKALAQQPGLLLLDEPTSHLDIGHQVEILDLLWSLNQSVRMTVLIVMHDLNLAALYCEDLFLMSEGRLVAEGRPAHVLTGDNLERVYGCEVIVGRHPVHGCPTVTLRSGRKSGGRLGGDRDLAARAEEGRAPLVHVFGGGGSSGAILRSLVAAGYRVTTGPLNGGDTDLETARALGIEVIAIEPFSAVDGPALKAAQAHVREADAVVVGPAAFGRGNLCVLETALSAAKAGTPVALMAGAGEAGSIETRDFTGGAASFLAASLLTRGAVGLDATGALVDWLAVVALPAKTKT